VVAEGVETVTHGEALLRLGYEQAQRLRHRAADAGRRPAGLDRILEAAPVKLFEHAAKRA